MTTDSAGWNRIAQLERQLVVLAAENARLRQQLRIATELLELLAATRGQDMRYPGEHATLAEDALIQMSVMEG